MSTESSDSLTVKSKPKKKSVIERELETSLTEKFTSPVIINDKCSTSRYGRARRSKADSDFCDTNKVVANVLKSPKSVENQSTSPAFKMYASNSPVKKETPQKSQKLSFDNQIENIYNENEMMSRFSSEKKEKQASVKISPKIYVRKDLIQRKEKEETMTLIKNMFSPSQSPYKSSNSHLNNYLERSSEKHSWNKPQNGHVDMSSVVKTLDFGGSNKKKNQRERANKGKISKSDLFEIEAKCVFQVGDLAWARIGTFPFWPCIVTRDPENGMFVKKKLFGRIERDIVNVTFFCDNGRRSWVVENMLRSFKGKAEFIEIRDKFTPEDKKKDPKLYAAFFVSEKKQQLWDLAINEAETLLKEPKRFRIDSLNEMILKARAEKFSIKKSSKITRTDSDVSLSESLYDSLFSEEDIKDDTHDRSGKKSRNKSFDVSDVVTACLDNMAAKTGITKIKKQSHMDRWLQKAKSKTPEKNQIINQVNIQKTSETKSGSAQKNAQQNISRSSRTSKRKSGGKVTIDTIIDLDVSEAFSSELESNSITNNVGNYPSVMNSNDYVIEYVQENGETGSQFGIIAKIESLSNQTFEDSAEAQNNIEMSAAMADTSQTNNNKTIESNSKKVEDQQKIKESDVNVDPQAAKAELLKSNVTVDSSEVDSSSKHELNRDSPNVAEIPIKTTIHAEVITTDIVDIAESRKKDEDLAEANVNAKDHDKKIDTTVIDVITENVSPDMTFDNQNTELDINRETICKDVTMEDKLEKEVVTDKDEQILNDIPNLEIVTSVTVHRNDINEPLEEIVSIEDNVDNCEINQDGVEIIDNCVKVNQDETHEEIIFYAKIQADGNDHNTNCATEDVEMDDVLDKTNNKINEIEKDISGIKRDMNDLETKIDSKKKSKKLKEAISKVYENTVIQINGDIGYESDTSKTNLETSLEEKSVRNKCEQTVHKETKTRKRFSLRRQVKDKLNFINVSRDETKIVEETEKKSTETDLNNKHLISFINIDETSSIEQKLKDSDLNNKQPNPFIINIDEISSTEQELKTKIVEETEKKTRGTDLNNKQSISSINIDEKSSTEQKLIESDLNNKQSHPSITNIDEISSTEQKLNATRLDELGNKQLVNNDANISPNYPKIIKVENIVVSQDSTDIKLNENNINNQYLKIQSGRVKSPTPGYSPVSVSTNIPSNESSNGKDNITVKSNNNEMYVNGEVQNNSIVNDLDSCKSKLVDMQQPIPMNESEKTNPSDPIQLAKTDSVKLNIMDTEVCISDGNVPRVTDSPFESTKNVDHYSKENSPDRFDVFDSESINSENSEIPLSKLSRKKHEDDLDTVSLNSNISSSSRRSSKRNKKQLTAEPENIIQEALGNAEFVKYMELRQDQILDENPDLTQNDLIKYFYKTWLYEQESKSDRQKTDDLESSNIVKGFNKEEPTVKPKRRVNKIYNNVRLESMSISSDENESASKRSLRSRTSSPLGTVIRSGTSSPCEFPSKEKIAKVVLTKFTEDLIPEITKFHNQADKINTISTPDIQINNHIDPEVASIDSENSDVPLIVHKMHREKLAAKQEASKQKDIEKTDVINTSAQETSKEIYMDKPSSQIDDNLDAESVKSEDSTISSSKPTKRYKEVTKALDDPEFVKYLELRQDNLMDEHPELCYDEIVQYLHKTWLYEESSKSETKKNDDIKQLNLVKGLNDPLPQPKRIKKKVKAEKYEKDEIDSDEVATSDKPKRKVAQTCYNEDYLDIEDDIEYFEIFKKKPKSTTVVAPDNKEPGAEVSSDSTGLMSPKVYKGPMTIDANNTEVISIDSQVEGVKFLDKAEIYFQNLTKPKPNLFKGIAREKVCELCEKPSSLVKCKGCQEMFHPECVKKEMEIIDVATPTRGRKKKKKPRGRKPKSANDSIESGSHSDEQNQGLNNSEDYLNMSVEDIEPIVADADSFEAQAAANMKELMKAESNPYTFKSNIQIDWATTKTGKCEIVDVKVVEKIEENIDYSHFKCNNCQKTDIPVCFVCKSPVSPKSAVEYRQKCQYSYCPKYYHLECLDHWPQTQFNSGDIVKNKKNMECHEALTCPRHVCHTCVSDDPRGCKTRFSSDKLARCVRCPATYHTFTKCLPAGTQILTGSHIICPRHYEHRPGKVPCHVNTGWCFICALGGILICCEYCPTSFHADCLNISPPEGNYMCEDCETGRLPLYGEMVWVKLGHYRWWPGLILHPSEIPANIMAVKHSLGEFVVRFFGQYDHYWVNRGRVFPFQEGDSGRISSQKSKIDAAFTMAMEHAQRACQILKIANSNQAESDDIASSLLPPHYVKLKVNKPCGSLIGRRVELEESSLTQCECDPNDIEPCGPNSQCLNRMLLTECGPTCRSGDRCQNRAFEKRQYPKLTPYRTPYRGWGLKTLEDIKMGQFVIEYVGELIDEEEFRRRMSRMHDVRDENFYFLTLDKERMIDAGPKGNLARFMNHCCEPNCETQKWTVLADVRVGLFALSDIPAGSEVTFNYNLECAGIEKKRCLCGARRCSGYIGAKPKQEESQPKKPRIPGTKRVYRKRKPEESPTITKTKMPKPRTTSRSKPKELTEIEKDLLIIKSATNGLSSDSEASGRLSSFDMESDKNQKLKRKRVSFSSESEVILLNSDIKPPCVKRCKIEGDKVNDVGD